MQKVKLIKSFSFLMALVFIVAAIFYLNGSFETEEPAISALSSMGSRGSEVKAIQEKLKENGEVNI